MHLDRWTLLLQTVNFGILIWLLRRFLYRPLLRLSDARRAEVEHQFAEAGKIAAQASTQLASLEAARAALAAERDATLKSASAQAQQAAAQRDAQARQELQTSLAQGRERLAAEREQAQREAHELALQLGAGLALRLLQQLPAATQAEAWLERILQYLGGLSATQLQSLRAQLAEGAALLVRTAEALQPAVQTHWVQQLRRCLGSQVSVSFATDPGLTAGAELRFPQACLEFTWQSVQAALREQLTATDVSGPHANAQ